MSTAADPQLRRAQETGASQRARAQEQTGFARETTFGGRSRLAADDISVRLRQQQRRARRSPLESVTVTGWIVLIAGLACVVFGVALGWREVVMIGAGFLIAFFLATFFVLGAGRYRVLLDLEFTRVVVGERALGQVIIESTANRVLPPRTIEMPVGEGLATFRLPRMEPGEQYQDMFLIPTQRRGVITVGPARSVRGDVLGLIRRMVRWTEPVELYVHPRTVLLPEATPGLVRDLEGNSTRELTSSDISFHALRSYAPGDDRRHIHWKATARTGDLMVRQFEQTKRSTVALGLSTTAGDYQFESEFETAVSVMGSVALRTIRDGMDRAFIVNRQVVPARSGRDLLDGLSIAGYDDRAQGLRELAHRIAHDLPDATLVFVGVGSGVTMADLQQARLLLPEHAQVILFHIGANHPVNVASLQGMIVASLRSLEELPAVMRRVGEL